MRFAVIRSMLAFIALAAALATASAAEQPKVGELSDIERLLIERDCVALSNSYGHAIDFSDPDLMASLFAADGLWLPFWAFQLRLAPPSGEPVGTLEAWSQLAFPEGAPPIVKADWRLLSKALVRELGSPVKATPKESWAAMKGERPSPPPTTT